mgnify:FL=1
MAVVGSGNWWSKKNKYSICPKCDKKGYYKTSMVDNRNRIHKWEACMYCKNTTILETH